MCKRESCGLRSVDIDGAERGVERPARLFAQVRSNERLGVPAMLLLCIAVTCWLLSIGVTWWYLNRFASMHDRGLCNWFWWGYWPLNLITSGLTALSGGLGLRLIFG